MQNENLSNQVSFLKTNQEATRSTLKLQIDGKDDKLTMLNTKVREMEKKIDLGVENHLSDINMVLNKKVQNNRRDSLTDVDKSHSFNFHPS